MIKWRWVNTKDGKVTLTSYWADEALESNRFGKAPISHTYLEAVRKYYQGFGYNKRKPMFEKELKDLEEVYIMNIKELDETLEDTLPRTVAFMQDFIDIYNDRENVKEKLAILLSKKEIKKDLDNE